ncbi:hypothetical protein V6N11_059414 [Hibiscus sabdariffa]|uniref:Uncharacterized protein n=2 Tax=Hibiscus sabdariffa TaxID=183260 RepID=A0ABR2B579_9ROSI
MASITPFLPPAVPTASAFASKSKQLSVSSKPATPFFCGRFPRIGLDLRLTKGGFDVGRSNGGRSSVFACSTTPYARRVGSESERIPIGNKADGGATKGDLSQALSAMLPFVVAATAVSSLVQPSTFTWVPKEMYAPALGGIMLSIGIKLSLDDFALAVKRPLPLSVGLIVQYMLKPVLGLLIAKAFGVSPMFYAGFILTSCVAGAQLSSYASFLSKGDVAVSILLTSFTTIASVLLTPLLTGLLIGSVVPVDAVAMSKSILQVVLVPVALGLVLNTYAKPVVAILKPVMPFVAMICTSLCIGSPLALNRSQILSKAGLQLVLPAKRRSLSDSFVMQRNAKLDDGRLLATQFLGGSSQAVPAACSVVAMAIMGLSLASFWGNGYRLRGLPSSLIPETDRAVQAP